MHLAPAQQLRHRAQVAEPAIGATADEHHIDRMPGHGLTSMQAHVIECSLAVAIGGGRSEEHTSELQSLMRISYAVFCLKKKKQKIKKQTDIDSIDTIDK